MQGRWSHGSTCQRASKALECKDHPPKSFQSFGVQGLQAQSGGANCCLQVRVRGGLVYSVQGLEGNAMLSQVKFSCSGARTSPLPGIDSAVRQWQVGCGTPQPSLLERSTPARCKPRLVWLVCAQEECHFAVLACAWLARATLSHTCPTAQTAWWVQGQPRPARCFPVPRRSRPRPHLQPGQPVRFRKSLCWWRPCSVLPSMHTSLLTPLVCTAGLLAGHRAVRAGRL